MTKMYLAYLGALLLALHLLSSQVVQAQTGNGTDSPNTTMSGPMTMTMTTAPKGCGTTDAFTLLLPLAAAASLLLVWL